MDGWSDGSGVQLPCGLGVLWAWQQRHRDIVRRRRRQKKGGKSASRQPLGKGAVRHARARYHGRTSTHLLLTIRPGWVRGLYLTNLLPYDNWQVLFPPHSLRD